MACHEPKLMPPKRETTKRLAREKGLGVGVQLKRASLPSKPVTGAYGLDNSGDPWGWILNPVECVEDIKEENLLRACGISLDRSSYCPNLYASKQEDEEGSPRKKQKLLIDVDSPDEDVIIVSSDDESKPTILSKGACTKKGCKGDPQCLNYLGQEMWEDQSALFK